MESLFSFIVIAVIVAIIAVQFLPTKPMLCKQCGETGKPVVRARGSMGMELLCWALLIIPGIIYSVWRMTTKRKVCRHCGSEQIIPMTSPVAKQMLAKQ